MPQLTTLPGDPDIVFPSTRAVIFVDNCQTHGCPDHYEEPKGTAFEKGFWKRRIADVKAMDKKVDAAAKLAGWKPFRFLECRIASVEGLALIAKAGNFKGVRS